MKIKLIWWFALLQATANATVYDCFTFFNEIELLIVRLEELYEDVDYFVLVEASETFCGEPKPLYFQENGALFEKYNNKIIHVIVNDFPPPTQDPAQDRWAREKFQRNAIFRGIEGCEDNDIILISDVDEIPSKRAIESIKKFYRHTAVDDFAVCSLNMRLCLFNLNVVSSFVWEGGSKAAVYSLVKKHTPWGIKTLHHQKNLPNMQQAGWHFHGMGGRENIAAKLKAIYMYDRQSFISPAVIKQISPALSSIVHLDKSDEVWPQPFEISQDPDLFKKWTEAVFGAKIVPIDDSYPKYILDHLDHYLEIGWIR